MDVKNTFKEKFSLARDILIFIAAAITVVFNFFAAPIREDVRTNTRDVKAVDIRVTQTNTQLEIEKQKCEELRTTISTDIKTLNTNLNKYNENILITLSNINSRIGRVEGKLE